MKHDNTRRINQTQCRLFDTITIQINMVLKLETIPCAWIEFRQGFLIASQCNLMWYESSL